MALSSRVVLKERNGVLPESESPVKRPGRKVSRVLSSEGEEEDEALTPPKGQVGPRQPACLYQKNPHSHLPMDLGHSAGAGQVLWLCPGAQICRRQCNSRQMQSLALDQPAGGRLVDVGFSGPSERQLLLLR